MFSRIDQFMLATFLVVLALMGKVQAQIYTTTLPWAQGDTVIVSQSTDALGETIAIQTLSTIVTGAVVTTTPLVPGVTTTATRLTTTALAIPTTNTRLTTSTARRATTTTTPAIVATPTTTTSTSALVSTTSWYWFTSDDGNVYSTYYTPSYTTAVSATPAPSGTILDYSEYQASVNSAIATQGSNAALDSGAREGVRVALWGAVWAGVVGAGAVLLG